MEKINCYKTKDGQIFECKNKAGEHEINILVKERLIPLTKAIGMKGFEDEMISIKAKLINALLGQKYKWLEEAIYNFMVHHEVEALVTLYDILQPEFGVPKMSMNQLGLQHIRIKKS